MQKVFNKQNRKKYRLLQDTAIQFRGHKLYRIEAIKNFGNVKKGDLGGYIESEDNLSQLENCWVLDNAKVLGNAKVSGNAHVFDDALVYGNALVLDNAQVYGSAEVLNYAQVYEYGEVHSNAVIYGSAKIYGNSVVFEKASVGGYAQVYDNAEVKGEAKIHGDGLVGSFARIDKDADISRIRDYYVGKNIWSSGRSFTYTRSNKLWNVGCFSGTSKELIAKANLDNLTSAREYARIVEYVENMYKDLESEIWR